MLTLSRREGVAMALGTAFALAWCIAYARHCTTLHEVLLQAGFAWLTLSMWVGGRLGLLKLTPAQMRDRFKLGQVPALPPVARTLRHCGFVFIAAAFICLYFGR